MSDSLRNVMIHYVSLWFMMSDSLWNIMIYHKILWNIIMIHYEWLFSFFGIFRVENVGWQAAKNIIPITGFMSTAGCLRCLLNPALDRTEYICGTDVEKETDKTLLDKGHDTPTMFTIHLQKEESWQDLTWRYTYHEANIRIFRDTHQNIMQHTSERNMTHIKKTAWYLLEHNLSKSRNTHQNKTQHTIERQSETYQNMSWRVSKHNVTHKHSAHHDFEQKSWEREWKQNWNKRGR